MEKLTYDDLREGDVQVDNKTGDVLSRVTKVTKDPQHGDVLLRTESAAGVVALLAGGEHDDVAAGWMRLSTYEGLLEEARQEKAHAEAAAAAEAEEAEKAKEEIEVE